VFAVKSVIVAIGLAALFAAPAWPEQYFVGYEANGVYPEAEGWTRYAYLGGATRYFDEGALVLDAGGNTTIGEGYAWFRPGELDPGSDEVFVAQWRLRVDQLQGLVDPVVAVYSDESRAATFDFSLNRVHVPGAGFVATFAPGLFHLYEFRSADMLRYDLFLDGTLVYSGDFTSPALNTSFVAWGDGTLGAASVTRWDYFRFGVTPEPCTLWLVLAAALIRLKPRG
jgi:hypothetical protein